MNTNTSSENKYTAIDLFAGCGGFSQGFLKAGFEIVAASEIWSPAIETYKENHNNAFLIEGDITTPENKQLLYDSIKDRDINVIIGGPPCQAYSISGNRNPDDPRGQLYLDFAEIVDKVRPDMFVMENVKGLLHMKHVDPKLTKNELNDFVLNCKKLQKYKDLKRYSAQRNLNEDENSEYLNLKKQLKKLQEDIDNALVPLLEKIMGKFKELGYNVLWKVLNSANYGVAQIRERIIFMGTKHDNLEIAFPETTHINDTNQKKIDNYIDIQTNYKKQWVSSKSVLKHYEDWPENSEKSHLFTKHSIDFVKRLHETPIGGNVYENYSDAWWRLIPDKPARTVKENHGGVFVHYKFDRVCTPRELAALQSFDDNFTFRGNKSSILKQIGNAVPPLMAKAIALEIKKKIDFLYNKQKEIISTT